MSTSTHLSFPVKQKTFCLNLMGQKTDFIISSYEDDYLVIVAQLGTMGTILHARKEAGVSTEPIYHVSVMFGKRDEPMLPSLSDNGTHQGTIKGIVSAVTENCPW